MLIPKTRKEIYWAYLSGDTHLELPRPVTRDEIILYNACINGAGVPPAGGGGGAEQFVVNISADASSGSLVFVSDKTFSEIEEAFNAGSCVSAQVVLVPGAVGIYRLIGVDTGSNPMKATFSRASVSDGNVVVEMLDISESGDVSVTIAKLPCDDITTM